MHNAPAVRYPVGRSRRVASVLALVWSIGVAVCVGWSIEAGDFSGRHWLAVACVVVCAGVAIAGWRAMPVGTLRFDGEMWWWEIPSCPAVRVDLSVRLDLQRGLLLLLRDAAGTPFWCYVERALVPQRWNDLRRAVYAAVRATLPVVDGTLPS